jgi:hypothetical protein
MNTYTHNRRRIWYDRHLRFWTLQQLDERGNQVGDVEYTPNKRHAFSWLKAPKGVVS